MEKYVHDHVNLHVVSYYTPHTHHTQTHRENRLAQEGAMGGGTGGPSLTTPGDAR